MTQFPSPPPPPDNAPAGPTSNSPSPPVSAAHTSPVATPNEAPPVERDGTMPTDVPVPGRSAVLKLLLTFAGTAFTVFLLGGVALLLSSDRGEQVSLSGAQQTGGERKAGEERTDPGTGGRDVAAADRDTAADFAPNPAVPGEPRGEGSDPSQDVAEPPSTESQPFIDQPQSDIGSDPRPTIPPFVPGGANRDDPSNGVGPIRFLDEPRRPDPPVTNPTVVDVPDGDAETAETKIVKLFQDDRETMFSREGYAKLRAIFSEQFEQQFDEEIRQAYANDYDAMQQWLSANTAIKETFYTALKPPRDDVHNALQLMNQLRSEHPDEIARYGQLAIATAVVWDGSRQGIYDYDYHARRCKSTMPDDLTGALTNFDYLVRFDTKLGKRLRYLPWEFLVLLVDHRTPQGERMWAVENYFSGREMFGDCYHDVPYDQVMLKTQSEQAALNDKPYTLPSIREHGGVCAMQADFAARVGKSIGVPAAYVAGQSRYGEHHAWVMWIELKGATPARIEFSLESHGRYRYDNFYVGTLRDPHTGQQITDRTLELRLQLVGMDPFGKRHADLLMKSLPMIRASAELDADELLAFVHDVIEISPGNEAAWTQIAQLSRDGILTKKTHGRQLGKILDSLFYTFRNVPDFTWEIFDDLTAFAVQPSERFSLYTRLVDLYEKAQRPDLACEARLKLTDYLVAAEHQPQAVAGLVTTIMKFPGEGRYVPRMLDQLEQICDAEDADKKAVLKFYLAFLPKVPPMRGNAPSEFCVSVFERAIDRFKSEGESQIAAKLEAQLQKIKLGQAKPS